MKTKKGFYDLSVTFQNKTILVNTLSTLEHLGYHTVALNQIVDDRILEKKKKKKCGDDVDPIPPPIALTDIPEELRNRLKILQRVTVNFSEPSYAHKMINSENFKKYDIHAVIPTSRNALQFICSTLDVDIISVDPTSKSEVRWSRKLYNVVRDRGIWFELPYATAVLDSFARKNLINAGHLYHAFGKSKNILISSGAENPMQVRGPYDVINLGLLLGLSEEQAKSAITNAGQSVLLRAEARRRGKAVFLIEKVEKSLELNCDSEEEEDTEELPARKKVCLKEM